MKEGCNKDASGGEEGTRQKEGRDDSNGKFPGRLLR